MGLAWTAFQSVGIREIPIRTGGETLVGERLEILGAVAGSAVGGYYRTGSAIIVTISAGISIGGVWIFV